MKSLLILFGAAALLCSCASQPEPAAGRRTDRILAELHDPTSKNVVVVSHRGDWRNWPENSIDAIESVIAMGVDVMEMDLKLTKDSVLVLCHDKTIDRTTSGKGRVCDITYDSICRCVLRTAHNQKTDLRMPTLREALEVCKDRIVVNIDQGYEYYDLALAVTEELGVTDQVLIKGKRPAEVVAAKFAGGSKLWVNSLWSSLCGGLDDDRAFEGGPAAIYGKLIDMGATLIQTDRPELLISYLRSRGLHD